MSQQHTHGGELFGHPEIPQGAFKESHIFPGNATSALNGVLADLSLDERARTRALAIRKQREGSGRLRPILMAEVAP